MSDSTRDALIIGAGPAGSTAAILLARAGWDVTLVEQHRFPRDKVCGECLSSTGFDVLSRMDLKAKFLELHPIRLNRTVLHAADGESLALDLPQPMWGISRSALDLFLLNEAERAGVNILQPARCESLTPGPRPKARLRRIDNNQTIDLELSIALLADGKGALLPVRPAVTTDFGIKAHFENVNGPGDAIEMFGVGRHYGGLAPIEGNRTNAAFSVPAALIAEEHGDINAVFDRISRKNDNLRRRIAGARRCGTWMAAPLPRFDVAMSWPQGIIPLGNSAAALEPIGGEGMGLAMRSSELAAAFLVSQSSRGTTRDLACLRASMHQLWKSRSVACRVVSRLVASPYASGALLCAGSAVPVVAVILGLMGKKGVSPMTTFFR